MSASTWIHRLSAEVDETEDVIGGKARGLIVLRRLGLPVPEGFVINTRACRAFARDGRLPEGLEDELAVAVTELEAATRRRFGDRERPLAVSVRSGSSISMPGMMATILDLGLAAESPADAMGQLKRAMMAVFSSWNTARAHTYREIHGIPHDLGTAVTVQAMVFGNRDDRSGSGVAFSRDPNTGERCPYGEVLFGRQGDEVVSGRARAHPLRELAAAEPSVWAGLLHALERIERHYRDACYVEFTFESGELWLLQVRPGRFVGRSAVRVATDLADKGVLGRDEAVLRISPEQLRHVRTPRIAAIDEAVVLARGVGACPGVAVGRIATTSDSACRMAAGGPVILARPETSPADLRGLAAAAGVITARGGPASHAAVVARAMGKPAVVGIADLDVGVEAVCAAGRTVPEGTLVAIDGTGGEVVLGVARLTATAADPSLHRLLAWADEVSGDTSERTETERLGAAHAVLRQRSGSGS